MKNIIRAINKNKYEIVLWVGILAYIAYFSYFTVLRFKTLYASYFDLGIMHQTVYNTYKALQSGDFSRFLELTNPYGPEQIKRMAIHNDILLAFMAPFYFIHVGPETLLIIQTVVSALGALFVYKIAGIVLKGKKYDRLLGLILSLAYLLYVPMERANIYEFHAVTLGTTLLLAMFYYWLKGSYKVSFLFFLLSIISKEEVALTTFFFGLYTVYIAYRAHKKFLFGTVICTISVIWFFLSVSVIIPHYRGGAHFALSYYSDFGNSPSKVIFGILEHPVRLFQYIFSGTTVNYLFLLTSPLGFISILSPLTLLIAAPELAINLLSNDASMRNIFFHYTAVITPFVIISAIYGLHYLTSKFPKKTFYLVIYILLCSIAFSYWKGPLFFGPEKEIHPFRYPQIERKEVAFWSGALIPESYKISTTGQLAPFFTSRRYFYIFSDQYRLADYVIIRPSEITDYPEKKVLVPIYNKLKKDLNFKLIYKNKNLEVYKKNA